MRNQKTTILVPKTMGEAIKFSKMLAASNMVPESFKGKPEDILVAVQWGSEIGLPIMSALQNIAVIQGKPVIYGDAALALVTSHRDYAGHQEWIEADTAHCLIKRKVGAEIVETERTFSSGNAKTARLAEKDVWKKYPARMLQMRARGYAIRDSFPDALKGIGIDDDREDIKDITPANPLDAAFGEETPESEALGAPPVAITGASVPEVSEKPDVSPERLEPPEESRVWELILDAGIIECIDADMWYGEFIAAVDRAANEEGVPIKDRRHNASVIKKANDDTIGRLLDEREDLGTDINVRYKKLIKALSAKAKEDSK